MFSFKGTLWAWQWSDLANQQYQPLLTDRQLNHLKLYDKLNINWCREKRFMVTLPDEMEIKISSTKYIFSYQFRKSKKLKFGSGEHSWGRICGNIFLKFGLGPLIGFIHISHQLLTVY